jgi:hypothetical protein
MRNKILTFIVVVVFTTMIFSGAFIFGHELKKSSDIKQERENMKFKRDSLEVELYKRKLK